MELRDILTPFEAGTAQVSRSQLVIAPKIRVALLSKRSWLRMALQQSLNSAQTILTQLHSIDLVERAADRKFCDIAIVDIERDDQWPETVFGRFDEIAATFPVIVLCKNKHAILDYRCKANYVFDIFSYETIDDPRFVSVVYAARLRAKTVEDISLSCHWDQVPPPAG